MRSVPLKVLCTNCRRLFRSSEAWFITKSYGELSSSSIMKLAFFRMLLRFPQDMMAVRNPAISMSSFSEKLWGIDTGSEAIKSGVLY